MAATAGSRDGVGDDVCAGEAHEHKSNTREGKNAVVNGEKNRKKRESERARERC